MYRQVVSALASICVAAALGACAVDEEAAGTVELDLVGQAPSGNVYVLRNAEITVTELRSGNMRIFRSEDDVNAARFRAHLLTGDYTAQLAPGWRLDQRTSGGDRPAPAVQLASPNPASFTVSAGATTRVALRFIVGGDGVTLEAGDLDIEVEVAEPAVGSIGHREDLGSGAAVTPHYLIGQRFDLAADAALLRLGHIGQLGGGMCRFAMYRDNLDTPGALVVATPEMIVSGRTEVAFDSIELPRGRSWLMTNCSDFQQFSMAPTARVETRQVSHPFYATLPSTFPADHEIVLHSPINLYAIVDFH